MCRAIVGMGCGTNVRRFHLSLLSPCCVVSQTATLMWKWWSTDCKHPHIFHFVVIENAGVNKSSLNRRVLFHLSNPRPDLYLRRLHET